MNFLRKIVSGKRKRFQDDKYNLDITFITDRVAGMSFPASGFEQCYRNNINDVRTLLRVGNLLYHGFRSHLSWRTSTKTPT